MGSEDELLKAVESSGVTLGSFGDRHQGRMNNGKYEKDEFKSTRMSETRGAAHSTAVHKNSEVIGSNSIHPSRCFSNITESLPIFDPVNGDIDVVQFIDKMEEYGCLYNWDDTAIIHYTLSRLNGNAACWRNSLSREERYWDDWKELLLDNFPIIQSPIKCALDAQNYRRRPGQNIIDYFYKKLALCNKANFKSDELVEWIVMGLDNNRFRDYLGPLSQYQTPGMLLVELVKAADYIDKAVSRVSSNGPVKINIKHEKSVVCYKCREKGHISNNCPNKRKSTCFVCHKEGHMARQCPSRNSANTEPVAAISEFRKSYSAKNEVKHADVISGGNSHSKYFKKGRLNGLNIVCYVDMGSSVTLIKESSVNQLKINWNKSTNGEKVIGYGAGVVEPIGSFKGNLEIDGVEAEVDILVVPNSAQSVPILVGHQYTEQNHIRIISDASGLIIESGACHAEHTPPSKVELVTTKEATIPDNYIGYMSVHGDMVNQELCIEGSMRLTGELIPRCIIKLDGNGNAQIPLLNISGSDIIVNKHKTVARGEICKESETKLDVKCKTERDEITIEKVNTELCGEDQDQLLNILNRYRYSVAADVTQIGKTSKAEMDIVLKDDVPIYYKPYRLAETERETFD